MGDSLSSGLLAHSVLHAEPPESTTSLQSSSSPIGRLPDELLLEVFSYACCEHINVGRLREPIWDLQQVCVRWQRVLRSTPTLWSAFQVTAGDIHVDSIALRVQSCLKLSRKNPLSISLVQFPPGDDENFPFKIYTELPNHANRWGSLVVAGDLLEHIVVNRHSVEDVVTTHGLPRLRKLTIIYSERYPYHFFRGASALKEFRLRTPQALPTPADAFPWMNIETFTFEDCKTIQSEKRFIHAFNTMAKTLLVLIWKENSKVLHYVPDTVITLSALQTLIVKDTEIEDWDPTPDEPVPLRRMFRMPALTDMQFIGDVATSFDTLLSMIQLSRSAVKKLQFKECCPAYMLPSAAKVLCDIEEVVLEDLSDPEECIPMLVWNTTDPLMCPYAKTDAIKILPSLRHLEIRDNFEDARIILMDIMRSRSATAAAEPAGSILSPLRSLTWMTCSSSADDHHTAALVKNLGNELGIKVEIDLHWDSPMVCRYRQLHNS